MTHIEQERKDGMLKKHDPQQAREKRWLAKEAQPKKRERKRDSHVLKKRYRERRIIHKGVFILSTTFIHVHILI